MRYLKTLMFFAVVPFILIATALSELYKICKLVDKEFGSWH